MLNQINNILPEGFTVEEISASVNDAYEDHQKNLNREWLKCLSEADFDYSNLLAPKQYDFYKTHIEPLDKKVVVIISDALRYEAAQGLLNEMHADVPILQKSPTHWLLFLLKRILEWPSCFQ